MHPGDTTLHNDMLVIKEQTLHNDMLVIKEQFHVPTFAVELCYGQSFITHMVGQEAVYDTRGEVFVSNHPQFFGVGLGGLIGGEFDDFVSNYAGSLVNGAGLDDFILHIVFCPGHYPLSSR